MAMKMKYEKPMIAVENFELSQAIAACVTKISLNNHECVKKDPDAQDYWALAHSEGWFTDFCLKSTIGELNDTICYHSSVAPSSLFTS